MIENNQKAGIPSPAEKLNQESHELHAAVRLYERIFGTIINDATSHPHHGAFMYLKGRLEGVCHAIRVMDL